VAASVVAQLAPVGRVRRLRPSLAPAV